MGATQVTSLHPVRVDGDLRAPVTVRNESSVTVYYRYQEAVSSTENNGNLTEHQEVTISNPTWFITKAPATTEPKNPIEAAEIRVSAAEPEIGQVGTGDLANLSVTTGKLAANAVTEAKTARSTAPASSGTESLTAAVGEVGVARINVARYTCKKEANAKVKIKHLLNTTNVQVQAWLTSSKLATEKLPDGSATAGAIEKAKVVSATEVELTLVAAEPAAGKEEFLYVIVG